MYDLPSEDPDEPGLPDEFHALQPQLLSATLRLSDYEENFFTGMDINLYYDVRHPLWHKRPDWFLALGVPRLYDNNDMRLSYVVWQEGVNPFIVVELLSPGTEAEDLGLRSSQPEKPPQKWQVYEQILRIPYYFVFNRYDNQFRGFCLTKGRYQPLEITDQKFWISELSLGLGVWNGQYQGVTRNWLRWFNNQQIWIPTPSERAEQARQSAEQARQNEEQARRSEEQARRSEEQARQNEGQARRSEEQARQQLVSIVQNLAKTGLGVEQISTMTGLNPQQIQAFLESPLSSPED